ncbi:MAG: hypothetical protein J6I40_07685 [Mailhella sp.]|nr:hypothetical protein [Mailhella sp.]
MKSFFLPSMKAMISAVTQTPRMFGAPACARQLFQTLMRFERVKTPEEIRSVLTLLRQRLAEPQYKDLRRLFSVWVGRVIFRNVGIEKQMPEFQNLLPDRS